MLFTSIRANKILANISKFTETIAHFCAGLPKHLQIAQNTLMMAN